MPPSIRPTAAGCRKAAQHSVVNRAVGCNRPDLFLDDILAVTDEVDVR